MAVITVLGANGFIGSRVARLAAHGGHHVVAIDRYTVGPRFPTLPNLEIVKFGGLKKRGLIRALSGYVIDCLPDSNPLEAYRTPLEVFDTLWREKLDLVASVCESAALGYTFLSSGGTVYGETPLAGAKEEDGFSASSPYSLNKIRIENFLTGLGNDGPNILIARLSTLFGLRRNSMSNQGVIHNAVVAAHTGETLAVFGDGSMARDYLYVDDAAKVLILLSLSNPGFTVLNVGSGTHHTISEVLSVVEGETGKTIPTRRVTVPPGFIHTATVNTSKMRMHAPEFVPTALTAGVRKMNEEFLPRLA